jgi:hypothetical protein
MSRFSRAEAEARGWVFVHEQPKQVVNTSGTQGEQRIIPPSLRAERYVNGVLINESAESEGKLLERIALYESRLDANLEADEATLIPEPEGLTFDADEEGEPLAYGTVILPGGEVISEAEWASREQKDVLVIADEDEESGLRQVVTGGEPLAVEAQEEIEEQSRELEDAIAAGDEIETEQIALDPADVSLDSPGVTGTSVLVVREGEGELGIAEIAQRRADEKAEAESSKSMAPRLPDSEREALEAAEAVEDEEQPEATPAAAELAVEEGVDLSEVEGSGQEGRILKADVEEAAASDED